MSSILRATRYGVAFGDAVVLADVSFEVAGPGMYLLMGPAAAGKSTLLRAVAGLCQAQPAFREWGELDYERRGGPEHPPLVRQHARLLLATVLENLVSHLPDRSTHTRAEQLAWAEHLLEELLAGDIRAQLKEAVVELPLATQRRIAICAAVASQTPLILLDEPFQGLSDDAAEPVLQLLKRLARDRAMLCVTHHHARARWLGGVTMLLAGGAIQETQHTPTFFEKPSSYAAKKFVRTGGCDLPAPSADPHSLRASAPPPAYLPPEASKPVRAAARLRGFHWLYPGALGGLPRPGIVRGLESDLDALKDLGITRLVCLEERLTTDPATLLAYGIEAHHFGIVDMSVPDIGALRELFAEMDRWLSEEDVVAVHCRAGMGRTGTVLACRLIWEGSGAVEALERARSISPKWVQSEEQIEFLERFEERVRTVGRPAAQSGGGL